MTETIKKFTHNLGLPRLIIISFFLFLLVLALFLGLPVNTLLEHTIVRMGMNGILVLAMVPSILSGTGPNFGLPLGIITGILGALISIQMNFVGWWGFTAAIIIALPMAILAGYLYGLLLNSVKGSELMVATYTGFSIVSLMSIGWLLLPFTSNEMKWPIGKGLRITILLDDRWGKILNNFWEIKIFGINIPTGLLLFFFFLCILVWLFFRSKPGIEIRAVGDNQKFAMASGMNVDKARIYGTILSTVLGAIGIIVYAQSFGFHQLYQAPLMMAFPAVAAILIGGASAQKAKISHVIIGVFLFQGLIAISLPVASELVPTGNLAEVIRMVVQNGIILYALTKVGGGE